MLCDLVERKLAIHIGEMLRLLPPLCGEGPALRTCEAALPSKAFERQVRCVCVSTHLGSAVI